jgi:AcrR family transcriptional regulator
MGSARVSPGGLRPGHAAGAVAGGAVAGGAVAARATTGGAVAGGAVAGDAVADDAAAGLADLIDGLRFPQGYRRIFLAAIEAFAERGFHGTSTRDIAARAGMSPAALYVHFGSKEEVLYRIATSALDLTQQVVSSAADGAAGPAGRLQAVVRSLAAWHACHSAAARVVLYQRDALTPEHLAEVTGKEREVDQIVRQIIADGVSAGEFDVADTAAAATAVLSLCVDVARWRRPGYRRSPEEIGDLHARAALRIVGAGSGGPSGPDLAVTR